MISHFSSYSLQSVNLFVNKLFKESFLNNSLSYKKIISQIKSLKIQGANNVAFYGLIALYDFIKSHKEDYDFDSFISLLHSFREQLFLTRPTEPKLRNVVDFCILHLFDLKHKISYSSLLSHIEKHIKNILKELRIQKIKLFKNGSSLIKRNTIIYTHCHSSSVTGILKYTFDNKVKSFQVHNTETRPLFQGRITANELADYGISITHYIDFGFLYAIKKANIILLGCDSIDKDGIYNKIGSEVVCELANKHHVPIYVCTSSLKFNFNSFFGESTTIEQRDSKEVWNKTHENISIKNYAFEKIDPKYITGIISDLGVHSFKDFIHEIIKKYN